MPSKEEYTELFMRVGTPENVATGLASKAKVAADIHAVLVEAGVADSGCDKSVGALLVQIGQKFPETAIVHRPLVIELVLKGDISSNQQLTAAVAYLKKVGPSELKRAEFDVECGVGVVVTEADMKACVDEVIASVKDELMEDRYAFPVATLVPKLKRKLRWANFPELKKMFDDAVLELLGPKTAEDAAKGKKKKAGGKDKAKAAEPAAADAKPEGTELKLTMIERFSKPEENHRNSPDMLAKHLKETGGKVVTRFPPEPNGYLHIGHAKAMGLSFSFAKAAGGECNLRFDDTNPAGESQEFIDGIQDLVSWLGHKPARITYSSDDFQKLYEIAVQLIKDDKAYVCHQTATDLREYRDARKNSPWRDRPIEESLREFENMRKGKYETGKAILRCKIDMQHDNPNMRDFVAYRVIYMPHPHAGDKWCIYPTYDFTHCLIDSLENITHSLCTLEFQVRQISYYWLLDAAKMYKPVVWEYSRLNLTNTIMSKRKLKQLVEQGHVRGWDDPRLPTLIGMRRRGYSPEAINSFVEAVGVTRSDNSLTEMTMLEFHVREDMNERCLRRLVVLNPLKVTLIDLEGAYTVETPNHPKRSEMGKRNVAISNTIYIDQADFRADGAADKSFFGLAPGKTVGLRYAGAMTCVDVVQDADGTPVELKCTYVKEWSKKPKGIIHWVDAASSIEIEARLFNPLLTLRDASEMGADWLKHVSNPSEIVLKGARSEAAFADVKAGDRFQFERVGFFTVDSDTKPGAIVVNRTVSLNEAKDKSAK